MVFVICPLQPSKPVHPCMLWRQHISELTSCALSRFPSLNRSCGLQIWSLSFTPGLTHLSVPLCKDPSTPPHIPLSGALKMCMLNFWCYYFTFSEYACKMKCLPGVFHRVTHLGPMPRFFLLPETCGFVDVQLLLILASAVLLGSESRKTYDHMLLSQILDSPNLDGHIMVFIWLRKLGGPVIPQEMGFT
jgi:hypothetical protein